MAHKKAGGSSKNGRDSNSKRLGVKRFGGNLSNQVKLSYANVVLIPIQVKMLVWAKITLYSLHQPVKCNSLTKALSKRRQSTSFPSKS